MATPLIVKRTSVPGREPTISNIELGEIAFNTNDGRVFIKKSQNGTESIVELGSVTSVNDRQGDVMLSTDEIAEGSNLYYTDTRVRSALSGSGNIQYDSNTGVINVDTSNFITFTGAETVSNKTLVSTTLKDVKEATVNIGNSGTAKTLDLANGSFQTVTMTGNCVFTMPPVVSGKYFTLFVDTGAGGFSGSFVGAKFPDNIQPIFTTKADCADIFDFVSDGNHWFGDLAQKYVLRVTYNVAPTASSINEGSTLTFNVNTNNFENGTLYWTINGANAADFVAASGTVGITDESGSFSITTVADLTTEGAETFHVDLRTDSISGIIVASSTTVTINDTSRTPPTYAVAPSVSSVDEGSSVTFTVTTTDFDDGPLYWTIDGAQSGDFDSTSGTVNVVNNSGSFVVSLIADQTAEGAETFRVYLRTGSIAGTIVATSSYVTINDTSVPLANFVISPSINGISEWYFPRDGQLSVTTPGVYTLTAQSDFTLAVSLKGAGGVNGNSGKLGGPGGSTTGNVTISQNSVYQLVVGSTGSSYIPGPYGGGGTGGGSAAPGGAGGGYSGLFYSSVGHSNSILIAGGGGGGHGVDVDSPNGVGGTGGGANGTAGTGSGSGSAGTQSAGGAAGGSGATAGSELQGGNGGIRFVNQGCGGGGGGGYYGGGGGARGGFGSGGQSGAPGGGGSGYIGGHPSAAVSSATTSAGLGQAIATSGTATLSLV